MSMLEKVNGGVYSVQDISMDRRYVVSETSKHSY
jgi:hypothetical protein